MSHDATRNLDTGYGHCPVQYPPFTVGFRQAPSKLQSQQTSNVKLQLSKLAAKEELSELSALEHSYTAKRAVSARAQLGELPA